MELEINKPIGIDINKIITKEKVEFDKILINLIDKGSDYILKSLPIQENLKDILIDVKKSFKSKDFGVIINTAVTSSIREGLEIVSAPISVMNDINKIKDIAIKGGLKKAINTAIDIITNKYIKGNLFSSNVTKFVDDIKLFINSKSFDSKIDKSIEKVEFKQEEFKNLTKAWYNAYEKIDIKEMNNIAEEIKSKEKSIFLSNELCRNVKIIKNMTQLINTKKDKLSSTQIDLCNSI